MKYVTKEVKIACAGIAAVAVLFFGIKFLRGINMFKATNYYYVAYDNIGGLTVSSPVYADGYNIGIVRNIDYDHERPGHVTVEIDVEEGLRIPKGSQAELVTEMLGTVKMNLLLANNPRERVEVGDTIPRTWKQRTHGRSTENDSGHPSRCCPKDGLHPGFRSTNCWLTLPWLQPCTTPSKSQPT